MSKNSGAVSASDVDILLCFDTTGSMYPVIGEVRRRMTELVAKLDAAIPGVRIAIGACGDYCDAPPCGPYVTKFCDFTTDREVIRRFINSVEQTGGGGNGGEAYELLFAEAQKLFWKDGHRKAMVLVADEIPHTPNFVGGSGRDWRAEVEKLKGMGVQLYGIQALDHWESRTFYPELARLTSGYHLRLNQFSSIVELLMAIGLQQSAENTKQLDEFEEELKKRGLYSRAIGEALDTIRGRKTSTADKMYGKVDGLKVVPNGRFQVIEVPKDMPIKQFVQENGLPFRVGRGFYEFMKTETIQDHKEIVLMDKRSGDMYTGTAAREMLKLPEYGSVRIAPTSLDRYRIFVQSTSANRKLIGKTNFLYEVQAS